MAARYPVFPPAIAAGGTECDQQGGKRYAGADAAKVNGLQILAIGERKVTEDDRCGEDQHEGTGYTGEKPHDRKHCNAIADAHGKAQRSACGNRQVYQRALDPRCPAEARDDRPEKVADIIGRGDDARIAGRQAKFCHHAGQDRRENEPADTHADGHCHKTAKREPDRIGTGRIHAADIIAARRSDKPINLIVW